MPGPFFYTDNNDVLKLTPMRGATPFNRNTDRYAFPLFAGPLPSNSARLVPDSSPLVFFFAGFRAAPSRLRS